MHTRITVTLVVLFSFAFGAQQQPQPTFKSTVQVVEVDVRVFDKDGRFVRDLKAEDFELIEDDAPQKIEAVFLVEPAATSDAPSTASSREPVAAAPDPAPAPVAPQTWIFFFDLAHLTPGGGFDRARKAVEDFVRDRFKQGDVAGILAGDKMINNRLTSVREELLGAVKEVKPRNDSRTRFIELSREWPRFMNEPPPRAVLSTSMAWAKRSLSVFSSRSVVLGPLAMPSTSAAFVFLRRQAPSTSLSTRIRNSAPMSRPRLHRPSSGRHSPMAMSGPTHQISADSAAMPMTAHNTG